MFQITGKFNNIIYAHIYKSILRAWLICTYIQDVNQSIKLENKIPFLRIQSIKIKILLLFIICLICNTRLRGTKEHFSQITSINLIIVFDLSLQAIVWSNQPIKINSFLMNCEIFLANNSSITICYKIKHDNGGRSHKGVFKNWRFKNERYVIHFNQIYICMCGANMIVC